MVLGAVLLFGGAAMRGYAQWANNRTEARLLAARPLSPDAIPAADHAFPPADSAPTRLSLPDLGLWNDLIPLHIEDSLDGPIWQTSDAGWHAPPAQRNGRGWPGFGGNVVMAGHSPAADPGVWARSVFRQLAYLTPGDRVEVTAGQHVYRYRVAAVFAIPEREAHTPEAAAWIAPGSAERLTLVTCWPPHTAAYRVIVVALPESSTLSNGD